MVNEANVGRPSDDDRRRIARELVKELERLSPRGSDCANDPVWPALAIAGQPVPLALCFDRARLYRWLEATFIVSDPRRGNSGPPQSDERLPAARLDQKAGGGALGWAAANASQALSAFEMTLEESLRSWFEQAIRAAVLAGNASLWDAMNDGEQTHDLTAIPRRHPRDILRRRGAAQFRRRLIDAGAKAVRDIYQKRAGTDATTDYGAIRHDVDAEIAAMREARGTATYERGDQESACAIVAERRDMKVETVKRYYSRGRR